MVSRQKFDRAWKLLEHKGWCQKTFARDKDGEPTGHKLRTACSFCTVGAILRIYDEPHQPYTVVDKASQVSSALGLDGFLVVLVKWNDRPERTKEEVIAVLKQLDI